MPVCVKIFHKPYHNADGADAGNVHDQDSISEPIRATIDLTLIKMIVFFNINSIKAGKTSQFVWVDDLFYEKSKEPTSDDKNMLEIYVQLCKSNKVLI